MSCKAKSCNRPAREDGYCLTHSPARQREARKQDPERFKRYTLQRDYGIAYDAYQDLLTQQNGACGICGSILGPGDKKLAVDHNHLTGIVRGLLCSACNVGLGHFKDSVELLDKAKQYLQQAAPRVLVKLPTDLANECLSDLENSREL